VQGGPAPQTCPPPQQVPGKAIWHLQNARNPFSGRVSALDPARGAYSAPNPLDAGEGASYPLPRTPPPLSALRASHLSQNSRLGPSQHCWAGPAHARTSAHNMTLAAAVAARAPAAMYLAATGAQAAGRRQSRQMSIEGT